MNELRTITISKPLAQKVDKLIDPTRGIYFSDLIQEAIEVYLMQVELAKAKMIDENPKLVLDAIENV